MLKLRRFLKPFLTGLLLAIALLFIQAICELSLPNFMSDIVNVGIQQGGVESSTPSALSQKGYTFIQTFMSEEERTLLESSYTRVSGSETDENGRAWAGTWPKAADEDIQVLSPAVSRDTAQQLDAAFGNATWTMALLFERVQGALQDGTLQGALQGTLQDGTLQDGALRDDEQAAADEQDGTLQGTLRDDEQAIDDVEGALQGAAPNLQQLDLETLYELQPLLAQLPDSWYRAARTEAAALDSSLRTQSGTMLTAAFYRELGRDMGAIEMNYILRIGLLMLLITALSGAASVLVGFLAARIGAGVARDVRAAIFDKVSNFSHAEFDRFSTASLITRSTNDVTVIQMLLTMGIRMICYAPVMGIGGVYMALSKSVSMSWIIGVAVIVLIGLAIVFLAIVMPKFKLMQQLVDRLNLVARESLNGLAVIHAFSRSGFEKERFEAANLDLTATNRFVNRAMAFMMPLLMVFMNVLSVLIIWVGAHQVANSQMQVGDMMAYMQYVMQIVMSFMFIAMMFVFIPRASVSAERIGEVLSVEPAIIDPPAPEHMDEALRGWVEFRDVSFRYAGAQQDALSNISFTAQPGQTTAFIGSTGSGKSTIINLIPRFYDATSGQVLVGGVDVRELAQAELRAHIGYVPQQNVLMAGTIRSNLLYGVASSESGERAGAGVGTSERGEQAEGERAGVGVGAEGERAGGEQAEARNDYAQDYAQEGLTPQEMEQIVEIAQARAFIEELDEGLDAPVAQGGSNVSGGQRQRLAIARALAVKPDIYLFDDSFSALDFATDVALRAALKSYTRTATLIIVAQRVSTIMDADQIIVIDDGRMVGKGTHAELLHSCEAYFEIASSQLAESLVAPSVSTGGQEVSRG